MNRKCRITYRISRRKEEKSDLYKAYSLLGAGWHYKPGAMPRGWDVKGFQPCFSI